MWCVNHLARLLPTLLVGACALFAMQETLARILSRSHAK